MSSGSLDGEATSSGLLIVTGGGSGIGAATARLAAENGWNVLNLSRTGMREPLPPGIAHRIETVQVDLVRDFRENRLGRTRAALAPSVLTQETIGPRRIALVHNAAFTFNDTAREPSLERMSALLELSTLVPAYMNELLIPHMGRGSSILYVGSTLSHRGVEGSLSYVTAKHALLGLMRATAKDLSGSGIHSVCVCPGPTDTPMLRGLYGQERLAAFTAAMSERRLATPEEIARVILFAASSPQLNGAVIDAAFGEQL
jgi:3-oxoacyl-[acyl-carrier protein] reductase